MTNADLQKIMFFDIETVPQTSSFSELSNEMAQLWEEKFQKLRIRMPEKYKEDTSASEAFDTSAGIYSEFGKIVCISVGFIYFQGETMYFRTKSFASDDKRNF